jgi:aspartate ammonia-lyase
MKYRTEKDLLGSLEILAEKYYGIHTERALQNFDLTGRRVNPALIKALAVVKKACCQANIELGYIDKSKGTAILSACDDIIEGRLDSEFPLDALQGGAGTSTNMNMNEVIANRALELLGHARGEYEIIHPVEHINLHQSTNDVYPTAVKVATIFKLRSLSESLAALQNEFQYKEQEFADIIKTGRTELQEAVPITLGAEFSAFAEAFARDRWRTFKAEERIRLVNIGGTAVGTGLTAPRKYIFLVIEKLRQLTGQGLSRGENCVDQTANADCFVEVSGIMQACAVNFEKVCRDLRQLHFIGEIRLAPVQAGSSIMPGKVNPVIMESIIQASREVKSLNRLVEDCACSGTLQINEYLPQLADSLLRALDLLIKMSKNLAQHCGLIEAVPQKCLEFLNKSTVIITAFLPLTGYDKAEDLLQEFSESGEKDFRKFLEEKLGAEVVNKTLSPHNIVSLGYRD